MTTHNLRDIWAYICQLMNQKRISPVKLAYLTEYSRAFIERGTRGEPAPITIEFLQDCVRVLVGSVSGRTKMDEDPFARLTEDECVEYLKPPPAMPPRQGNFWEHDDEM